MLSSHLRSGLPRSLVLPGFLSNIHLFSPIRATCPAQLTVLDFMTLIILFGKSTSYEAPHYEVL
jgi:hypothetical protein